MFARVEAFLRGFAIRIALDQFGLGYKKVSIEWKAPRRPPGGEPPG